MASLFFLHLLGFQALVSITSFIIMEWLECVPFLMFSCWLLRSKAYLLSPRQMPSTYYILQLHLPLALKRLLHPKNLGNKVCITVFPLKKAMCFFSLLTFICPRHCEHCVLLVFTWVILCPETPDGNLRSESIPQSCYRLTKGNQPFIWL